MSFYNQADAAFSTMTPFRPVVVPVDLDLFGQPVDQEAVQRQFEELNAPSPSIRELAASGALVALPHTLQWMEQQVLNDDVQPMQVLPVTTDKPFKRGEAAGVLNSPDPQRPASVVAGGAETMAQILEQVAAAPQCTCGSILCTPSFCYTHCPRVPTVAEQILKVQTTADHDASADDGDGDFDRRLELELAWQIEQEELAKSSTAASSADTVPPVV